MQIKSSMRVTALLAAAFTLAACGSDKAAGPTTANNAQIISELNATLADTASFNAETDMFKFIGLQVAVAGLTSGAPVNPGNVSIDGNSYRFSTTSLVAEERDSVSGDVLNRMNIIVGWRHTNGDSVFVALYASDPDIYAERGTSLPSTQLSNSSTSRLADVAAMLRSGRYTISRSVSAAGPDQPALFAVYLGGSFYAAAPDEGLVSGSASLASASGECDLSGLSGDEVVPIDADSCTPVSANVSLQANTFDPMSESDPPAAGPVISLPAQAVVGVKFVSDVSYAM